MRAMKKTRTGNIKLKGRRTYAMYYLSKHLVRELDAFASRVHLDVSAVLRTFLTALVAGHPIIKNDFEDIVRDGIREATVGPTRVGVSLSPSVSERFEKLVKKAKHPFVRGEKVGKSDIVTGTMLWILKNQKRLVAYEMLCLPCKEQGSEPEEAMENGSRLQTKGAAVHPEPEGVC